MTETWFDDNSVFETLLAHLSSPWFDTQVPWAMTKETALAVSVPTTGFLTVVHLL